MAFFDPWEVLLASDNGFYGVLKGELRIKPAGNFVMSCANGFYAAARKGIFLVKKAVKQLFIYFFNDEGERAVTIFL
jgi:hypothetical protein